MENLSKYIIDKQTGLKYELIGDYYVITGDDGPEDDRSINIGEQ